MVLPTVILVISIYQNYDSDCQPTEEKPKQMMIIYCDDDDTDYDDKDYDNDDDHNDCVQLRSAMKHKDDVPWFMHQGEAKYLSKEN